MEGVPKYVSPSTRDCIVSTERLQIGGKIRNGEEQLAGGRGRAIGGGRYSCQLLRDRQTPAKHRDPVARRLGGRVAGGGNGAQLRQDLQHAIEMGQSRPEAVDELVEHKVAVGERFFIFNDFVGQIPEKLRLHAAQSLRRSTTVSGEFRVGLFPLPDFRRPLSLSCAKLLSEVFQQLILSFLPSRQLAQQGHDRSVMIGPILVALIGGRGISRDIDSEYGRYRLWVVHHRRGLQLGSRTSPV
jgi:hypothetical protein